MIHNLPEIWGSARSVVGVDTRWRKERWMERARESQRKRGRRRRANEAQRRQRQWRRRRRKWHNRRVKERKRRRKVPQMSRNRDEQMWASWQVKTADRCQQRSQRQVDHTCSESSLSVCVCVMKPGEEEAAVMMMMMMMRETCCASLLHFPSLFTSCLISADDEV